MNVFTKFGCRVFQQVARVAMNLVPWDQCEKTFSGPGSISELPKFLKEKGFESILIVTDGFLFSSGKVDPIMAACEAEGMRSCCYHDVVPNPTIGNIEDGLKMYHENNCDAIVAVGGGSAMDCAKTIAARVCCPNKSVQQMKGLVKIWLSSFSSKKHFPPLVAIPTTSGTGSEATLAAIVSNPETHEKYPIEDPLLIPRYVVMDPELTKSLPPHLTSTTGMDALTHAVESYIGSENTKQTKKDAIEAVQLIYKYLQKAYDNGEDLEARVEMQKAAYLAGKAFTRAYVGYVHAIAHSLGGQYGVPHGLANAVILPRVLKAYGKSAHKKLAQLADCVGIEGADNAEKANNFIKWIDDMNTYMNIPDRILSRDGSQLIKEEDLPVMVAHAYSEANPLYPCPQVWGKKELEKIYREIM